MRLSNSAQMWRTLFRIYDFNVKFTNKKDWTLLTAHYFWLGDQMKRLLCQKDKHMIKMVLLNDVICGRSNLLPR